jgi:hypothetical protein
MNNVQKPLIKLGTIIDVSGDRMEVTEIGQKELTLRSTSRVLRVPLSHIAKYIESKKQET